MAIRKRGNRWVIDYYDPDGKRVVKGGFLKRKDAEAELAARHVAIDDGSYRQKAKPYISTFDQLVEKYEENFKHQRSYARSKSYHIAHLKETFGNRLLKSITYLDLETYRNQLKRRTTRCGGLRADASVNRVMACLRHMLGKAVAWKLLDRNPFDEGGRLQFKENNKRLRFLSEEEIDRLLAECPTKVLPRVMGRLVQGTQAVHLKDFVVIAINTGMRKGEILSLKWDQIRHGFIYLEKTKNGEARQIPINEDLVEHFKDMRRGRKLGVEYLFTDGKGGHIHDIKTAFNSAVKRAKIGKIRPHDLRHTFASHYMMRGGTLGALQKILGHADVKMTMRYAHLSREFARKEIENLVGLTRKKKRDSGGSRSSDADGGSNNLVTFPSAT